MAKYGRAKVAISVALAVALLAFFLSRANLRDVGHRIREIVPGFFLASLACSVAGIFLRSWRWMFLLRPVGRVGFGSSLAATSIGYAASTVLPARAGEVVRPVVLSRRTPIPLSAGLASVLLERAIDLATVLLFFLVYCLAPGPRPALAGNAAAVFSSLRLAALALGTAAAIFFLLAFAATGERKLSPAIGRRLLGTVPARFRARVAGAAASFLAGIHSVRRPRILFPTLLLSGILWAVVCAQVYFLFRAFRLPLAPAASILVVVVTLVGLAIPTPGGVGGYHKLCQAALTMFYAVDVDAATGFAIVAWFVSFAPVTLLGFGLFAAGPRRRESFADLAGAATEE